MYRVGRAVPSTSSAARLTHEGQAPRGVRFSLEADEDSERCATVNRGSAGADASEELAKIWRGAAPAGWTEGVRLGELHPLYNGRGTLKSFYISQAFLIKLRRTEPRLPLARPRLSETRMGIEMEFGRPRCPA